VLRHRPALCASVSTLRASIADAGVCATPKPEVKCGRRDMSAKRTSSPQTRPPGIRREWPVSAGLARALSAANLTGSLARQKRRSLWHSRYRGRLQCYCESASATVASSTEPACWRTAGATRIGGPLRRRSLAAGREDASQVLASSHVRNALDRRCIRARREIVARSQIGPTQA
jgi:hypothetical protein